MRYAGRAGGSAGTAEVGAAAGQPPAKGGPAGGGADDKGGGGDAPAPTGAGRVDGVAPRPSAGG